MNLWSNHSCWISFLTLDHSFYSKSAAGPNDAFRFRHTSTDFWFVLVKRVLLARSRRTADISRVSSLVFYVMSRQVCDVTDRKGHKTFSSWTEVSQQRCAVNSTMAATSCEIAWRRSFALRGTVPPGSVSYLRGCVPAVKLLSPVSRLLEVNAAVAVLRERCRNLTWAILSAVTKAI